MERTPLRSPVHLLRRASAAAFAVAFAATVLLSSAAVTIGASPSPSPGASPAANPDLRIDAHALLGGNTRPGAWTAVDVVISNDGPPITGEVRIRAPQQQANSQYGVEMELPTGARQHFTLYAQTALFGSRLNVDVVSGDQALATQQVSIRSHDAYSPIVAVVAEHPEHLLAAINAALVNPNVQSSSVITLTAADLPPRVEAWAAIDRLVWQDVDAATLSPAQLDALRLWIGAGGQLVILGGTTGVGSVHGFGSELLPFDPEHTVDAAPADLAALLGQLPSDAASTPAFGGTLDHGAVLARSGNDVIAAQAPYGRGVVTLIGFDPGTDWIASGPASATLWHRLLPQISGPALNPLTLPDDSQIVYALQNLPSVDLPPIEQLLFLLVAYIVLIGPINYLVLRRLDRREWAWVTIPVLVVVFAAGSYGLGATLKGSDVIVNEIAVVRAAQGTGRGIGQVYVGIYSPSRRSFEVSIPGGALLSSPTSQSQNGQTVQPLDVVLGESSSRLRNFEVGFGVLRGFRAEAPADAPAVESNLRLSGGKLQGEIINRSNATLENVAVLFGGAVAVFPELDPGASQTISLDTSAASMLGYAVSERIFGSTFPVDQAEARAVYTRRTVIDQLFPYGTSSPSDTPLLLAWRDGPVLDVDLAGDNPNRVGEGLFMIPLGMTLDSQQAFGDQLMRRTIVETTASQGWGDMNGMYLTRGTMTVEARPTALSGTFSPSSLRLAITQGEFRPLTGSGTEIAPLPDDQQPDQDDPLAEGPSPTPGTGPSPEPTTDAGSGSTDGGQPIPPDAPPVKPGAVGGRDVPDFQLFDRSTGRWVEFPHPNTSVTYAIKDAGRYVDERGAVLFRFVNRSDPGQFGEDQRYFQLSVRIEGTVE